MQWKVKESSSNGSGCSGLFTVLFVQILFIVLKVTNSVNWNGWVVASPTIVFLAGIASVVVVIMMAIAIGAIIGVLRK